MRRQAQHQITWHPADRRYRISITMKWGMMWPGIRFESQEWHAWLASIPSFRFQGQRDTSQPDRKPGHAAGGTGLPTGI